MLVSVSYDATSAPVAMDAQVIKLLLRWLGAGRSSVRRGGWDSLADAQPRCTSNTRLQGNPGSRVVESGVLAMEGIPRGPRDRRALSSRAPRSTGYPRILLHGSRVARVPCQPIGLREAAVSPSGCPRTGPLVWVRSHRVCPSQSGRCGHSFSPSRRYAGVDCRSGKRMDDDDQYPSRPLHAGDVRRIRPERRSQMVRPTSLSGDPIGV